MTEINSDFRHAFAGLPGSARLWTFGVSRRLAPEEESRLLSEVDGFLALWKAHGQPLAAAREWRHERFLLVAVDERITPPSGCSIDALMRILRRLESELDVMMVGSEPIWYRAEGGEGDPVRVSRPDFREKVSAGEVTPDTVVFDLSLTRVGELREGKWERVAREGWHQRYFD